MILGTGDSGERRQAGEVLKWNGSIWLGSALAEVSEEQALMGWAGPRCGQV